MASRPRSLNLSLSNLAAVPQSVLELNAHVQKCLKSDSRHMRSSSDIVKITEERETEEKLQITSSYQRNESVTVTSQKTKMRLSELTASQPSLSTGSSTDSPNGNDFDSKSSSRLIHNAQSPRSNITSAYTAPSDLNKAISVKWSKEKSRRRSRSMENLASPDSECLAELCMRCGRVDKRSVCHGVSRGGVEVRTLSQSTSLHNSTEMIPVS